MPIHLQVLHKAAKAARDSNEQDYLEWVQAVSKERLRMSQATYVMASLKCS